MEIQWKRRLTIIGIILGVYIGFRWCLPLVWPFLAAWLLAVWLYPVTIKIEKRLKIKKSLSGAVLLTALFAVLALGLYFLAAEILSQVKTAFAGFPMVMRLGKSMLGRCCEAIEKITGIPQNDSQSFILTRLSGMQEQFWQSLSPGTLGSILGKAEGILVFFSGLVVVFICTLLIIADMESLHRKIWDYTWLVGTRRVIARLKRTTVTYIKAQLMIILCVAVVCCIGLWIMKSPYFLILGILLGALDALPVIGTGTFLYPAALYYLLKGNTWMAAGCVLLDIVTSILREFLEPRLLGDKLGFSPIAMLASVYVGVFLYGVWGVFLGPLSFSTVYEIGREWDVWD